MNLMQFRLCYPTVFALYIMTVYFCLFFLLYKIWLSTIPVTRQSMKFLCQKSSLTVGG